MPDDVRIRVRDSSVPPLLPEEAGDGTDPSLGGLFKKLSEDGRTLVQQEIALAKTEVKENVRKLTRNAALLVIGGAIIAVGLLVLLAFAVIGLGALLGENYWLSALIIGGAFCIVGAIVVFAGGKKLTKDELAPQQTAASLREDREWAQAEIRDARRELGS